MPQNHSAGLDAPNLRVALQRRYGGYLLEAASVMHSGYGRLVRQSRPSTRFVIFGRGRSGSTLLVSSLDSHPEISCEGEILRFRTYAPAAHLDRILGAQTSPVAGCKLLSYQMRTIQRMPPDTPFLRQLAAKGVIILHLTRENPVRHAISNILARKSRVYHATDAESERKAAISVTGSEVVDWIAGSTALADYERAVLRDVPHIPLHYETDLETPSARDETCRRLFTAFGVPYQSPKTQLRKVTSDNLRDLIANYDGLLKYLDQTPYAGLLQ